MGWASGSSLMEDVIRAAKPAIKHTKARKKFFKKVIEAFEGYDCDTLSECFGTDEAFDDAYRELHPDEDFDEDDELEVDVYEN